MKDDNGTPVQIGSSFNTTGVSGSWSSPLGVTIAIRDVEVPDDAVEFVISTDINLRISEDSSVTTYDLLPAGAAKAYPCARMSNIYVRTDSGAGNAHFTFTIV